ncbi:von Willebrand factor type A domain-containing protein [Sphingomonas sp. LB-2]|uniref:vWA domain-containing protein n=1 Tax=Sphingomonas caeni TaxID=2984949 RepID=UPI00223214E2|nr:VWA domain-containing protein [Sphingomonas caeni]MCW3846281.1 von Willebrand factor type A domain-containing protein [Sphingomonas caeni]
MSRSALLIGSVSLLLTSAAPPPLLAQDGPRIARQDRSPVRCHDGDNDRERYRPAPRGRPVPVYAPAPPPAPTRVQPQSQEVTVTGVRASLSNSPNAKVNSGQTVDAITAEDVGALPDRSVTESVQRVPGVAMNRSGQLSQGFTAAPQSEPYGAPGNTERYQGQSVASILSVQTQPISTFSVDVDTGAYSNVRRFLNQRQAVPAEAVRTEEMINYFRYDYPRPTSRDVPFSVTTDVSRTPWNKNTRLLRIGLRGYDVSAKGRPPANLVFLVDVSGSMDEPEKLPLVKQALSLLADRLTPNDKVSIVVCAGAAGVVLDPTSNPRYIKQALDCLEAGGSTAGGEGIKLAYDVARKNFMPGGINRIMLATDGDFNVGVSDNKSMEALVKRNRESGITLTTLGFGDGNYNEAMMERIADVGNGNYCYIDSPMEARKVLDDELSATLFTIAKDVKVQVEFNPAQVKEYRLIGYENRALANEDFANDAVDAGDIGAGHQVTALYEIVPADGAGWLPERRYDATPPLGRGTAPEAAFVKLRYKLPGERESRLISQPVWARQLSGAIEPQGDMAFIVAVAAFGQRLRGDKYLNGFSFSQIGMLAGDSNDYWRSEFGRLVRLADAQYPRQRRGD